MDGRCPGSGPSALPAMPRDTVSRQGTGSFLSSRLQGPQACAAQTQCCVWSSFTVDTRGRDLITVGSRRNSENYSFLILFIWSHSSCFDRDGVSHSSLLCLLTIISVASLSQWFTRLFLMLAVPLCSPLRLPGCP